MFGLAERGQQEISGRCGAERDGVERRSPPLTEGPNKGRCELPGCNAVVGLDIDSTIYKIIPRIIEGEEVVHVAQFCCHEHADAAPSVSSATLERTKRLLGEQRGL
jgi:hypothetical protein